MKALTLRGVDEELEKRLRAKSTELGAASLNATILRILRQSLGLEKRRYRVVHHDLDHLAGTWTETDAKEFEEATAPLAEIDQELWQ